MNKFKLLVKFMGVMPRKNHNHMENDILNAISKAFPVSPYEVKTIYDSLKTFDGIIRILEHAQRVALSPLDILQIVIKIKTK